MPGHRIALRQLIAYLIIDFDGYIAFESEAGYFDYKTRFKSQGAVRHLTDDILRNHRRALRTHPEVAFALQLDT